jgi:uncharacterized protein (TIGR02300 family)
VAKPELGMKRQCQNCGAKFFDLNRSPIVCPKCSTVFQAPALARAPAPRAAAAAEESDEADTAPVEIISLEDADAGDEKVAATAGDDIEVEDDDTAADETFLEEEEDDPDDVAGLIDGDIEDDEEG